MSTPDPALTEWVPLAVGGGGPVGPVGPAGPAGPTGPKGPTASSSTWTFSSVTGSANVPGTGVLRFDYNVSDVDNIFISKTNADGIDLSAMLAQIAYGQDLYVQEIDDPTRWVTLNVIGAVIDNPTHVKIPTFSQNPNSAGLNPRDGKAVVMVVTRATRLMGQRDLGGMAFASYKFSNVLTNDPPVGYFRFDNATQKNATKAWINGIALDGEDFNNGLTLPRPGKDRLMFQLASDPTNWNLYDIIDLAFPSSSVVEFLVRWVDGLYSMPNDKECMISIVRPTQPPMDHSGWKGIKGGLWVSAYPWADLSDAGVGLGGQGYLNLVRMKVDRPIVQGAFELVTVLASSNYRMCIYADDPASSTGGPGALLRESADISLATGAGIKTWTFTSLPAHTWYWVGVLNVGTTNPVTRMAFGQNPWSVGGDTPVSARTYVGGGWTWLAGAVTQAPATLSGVAVGLREARDTVATWWKTS
jgi:hypothetical protein